MKIIIQCAGTKSDCATKLINNSGDEIIFVADPYKVKDKIQGISYQRPDDLIPFQNKTWRQLLVEYNNLDNNTLNLLKAAELYKPRIYPHIYKDLVSNFGWENVFILSAGWGLIRSDYLLPYYDITFSKSCKAGSWRYENAEFDDFNFFPQIIDKSEEIHFFGSDSYLPLLYSLMDQKKARMVIHYIKQNTYKLNKYNYLKFDMNSKNYRTWVYQCADKFIKNHFP